MQAQPVSSVGAANPLIEDIRHRFASLTSSEVLTDEDAEALYALAYRDFNQANYAQALARFQMLLVHRPLNAVYMLGAALCLQRLRHYELAGAAFGALRYLEPAAPRHILAVAECQLLGHEQAAARETLVEVIRCCAVHPGHDAIRDRAQAMLELMKAPHEPVAA